TSWQVCMEDCINKLFELTATGQTSGLIAKTQFTDGNPQITGVSTNPFSPNNSTGVKDTTTITAKNQGGGAISDFRIRIHAGSISGVLVKEFTFINVAGNATVFAIWDGNDTGGNFVGDGNYV